MATNPEQNILDDIDALVDWQLEGGDRSDSFHGEQYRRELPCPWCSEAWHYLKITQTMQRMRQGSYRRDEFGYGIIDPEYRHDQDTSAILCPGSEFHGPRDVYGTWDKQSRERAVERSRGSSSTQYPTNVPPGLPPGRLRKLRFYGPFRHWEIALDDEQDIEELISDPSSVGLPGPRRRIPIVRERRLTATFEFEGGAIFNPPDPQRFYELNLPDIEDFEVSQIGYRFRMKPVTFPFRGFTVFAEQPNQNEPTYIEFETTYPIERHSWFMDFWELSGTAEDVHFRLRDRPHPPTPPPAPLYVWPHNRQGFESDYAIIDESREMPTNEIMEVAGYVDQIQGITFSTADSSTSQADSELQRGPQVLRGGQEDSAGWHRQVDAAAQPREVQEASGTTDVSSSAEATQAEATGSPALDARWDLGEVRGVTGGWHRNSSHTGP